VIYVSCSLDIDLSLAGEVFLASGGGDGSGCCEGGKKHSSAGGDGCIDNEGGVNSQWGECDLDS
jgi:hypothetical protein